MKQIRAIAVERDAMDAMLDHMATLADPLRCRMLLVLERQELTVSELCTVLQLPQSTVSRHLKTLADAAWVASRRDGTSRYYSLSIDELDAGARRLWPLMREQVASTSGADQDLRRLESVLARRRSKSRGVLLVGLGAVGSPAQRVVRRVVSSSCAARAARSGGGGGGSRLRHRPVERAGRAASWAG